MSHWITGGNGMRGTDRYLTGAAYTRSSGNRYDDGGWYGDSSAYRAANGIPDGRPGDSRSAMLDGSGRLYRKDHSFTSSNIPPVTKPAPQPLPPAVTATVLSDAGVEIQKKGEAALTRLEKGKKIEKDDFVYIPRDGLAFLDFGDFKVKFVGDKTDPSPGTRTYYGLPSSVSIRAIGDVAEKKVDSLFKKFGRFNANSPITIDAHSARLVDMACDNEAARLPYVITTTTRDFR